MPSEYVLYLFLLDACAERHIPLVTLKTVAHNCWCFIKQYGTMTVAIGEYTLTLLPLYPRVKRKGFLYVPIYSVY